MKARVNVSLVSVQTILLALAFTALTAPSVFGCVPDDEKPGRCLMPGPKLEATVAPARAASVSVVSVAQPAPSGLNPDAAIEPDGSWRSISPHTTLWYKIKYSGGLLQIWADTNGQTGLSMAIFAPDQTDLYGGQPIGRGSPNKNEGHDLFWTGRNAPGGTYFARVTNDSSLPISFSLNSARKIQSVADRCAACHGYGITFESCEDRGTAWCESLEDEYKH